MAHSLYVRNSVLHIILYLMCLCAQPVYHEKVVEWCAGDAAIALVGCEIRPWFAFWKQPSHFIANAQPVCSETTIY